MALTAIAAIEPNAKSIRVVPGQPIDFVREGVITGGQAADGFTMLEVRFEVNQDVEKISFYYGDFAGNTVPNGVGFFHVAVEPKLKRIVLNLSQIDRTAVGPEQLKQLLRVSKQIAASRLSLDPLDGSTEILLNMKSETEAKVILGVGPNDKHLMQIEFRKVPGTI